MLMLISVFVALADFPLSYLPQSGCQYLLTNFINSVGKWFCIAQQNDWWSVFLCINFQAKYIFRKKRSWMLRMGWDEKDGVKGYKCMNGVAGSTLSWADTSHCPSRLPPHPPSSHHVESWVGSPGNLGFYSFQNPISYFEFSAVYWDVYWQGERAPCHR